MCGIAGIWSKNKNEVSQLELVKMLQQLKHRGPDAEGLWFSSKLALGNTRLKILDLSDTANQPFTDGKDVLVFNGRIFNYLDLKKELSSQFHFKTTCDTEVLFRALQVWQEKVFDKIEGQFAFAFYSEFFKTLILARDHVGICPLYLREDNDYLYFASEIKPLLTIQKCDLDNPAVVDYFFYRYNIQNGKTLFREIRRFPPAHFLKINLKTRRRLQKRYWRLKFKPFYGSKGEIEKAFNRLISKEILLQQTADVPVGMYLSGGIDSGALLYGFSQITSTINAFTLSFGRDDSDYERVLALAKKIKFKKNSIRFSEENLDSIEDVVSTLEEPFGDLIICANWLLAKNACKSAKVVLSGEGGDEAFCGYDHQRAFFRLFGLSHCRTTKALLNILLAILPPKMLGLFQSYPGRFGSDELKHIQNVVKKLSVPVEAYLELIALFNNKELKQLFSKKFKTNCLVKPDIDPIREIFVTDKEVWQAVMRSEIEQLTLIINLLKQDRFAMHFSMEACVPFTSRRVLEFAVSLPYTIHNSKVNKELLLKYSGQPVIKKKPFSLFTTQHYLSKLMKLMDKYVTYEAIMENNILSWQEVEKLRLKLNQGNILAIKQAMTVLVFMVWHKVFKNYIN